MNNQSKFDLFQNEPDSVQDEISIPGLIYFPKLLSPEKQVAVLAEIDSRPWLMDLKRQVQHYGYKYNYKARTVNYSMRIGRLPSFAIEVAEELKSQKLIEKLPDQLIINEYKPGQGISAHIDCEPCFENTIVTISLGSVYDMDFICVESDVTHSMTLELGSALVLSGSARYDWMHRISARKSDPGKDGQPKRLRGRRVSLTYRNVILDESNR
ncbi:MAG: alpha-ketoglutarate-dependent dioxygenase AlkB [Opitutales bacterium]